MTILIKMTLFSKKGSSPVLRDTGNSKNQNAQSCNKSGCSSARMNSNKGGLFGGSEKTKSVRPSYRSPNGKEIVGSSLRTPAPESSLRKPIKEPRKKLPSQPEADSSVSSSLNLDLEKTLSVFQPDLECSDGAESSSNDAGSTSITSSTKKQRNLMKNADLNKRSTLPGSSVSTSAKSTLQAVKPGAIASRYGLRTLRCNTASDVIPSELNPNKKKVTVAQKISDGESSSSFFKGKKRTEQSLERRLDSNLSSGVSISDSRRIRNRLPSEDNGNASLGARRAINTHPRIRLPIQRSGNNLSRNESNMGELEVPITVNGPSSSNQISADSHSRSRNSFSRQDSSSSGSYCRFPRSPLEAEITRSLTNQDNQQYNMNGIAEVLLALERIEQDEELSYEQLLALETSLFLNGLSFHDQHRDMRLDIDSMSYEELLALEDKMGTVSTALNKEAIEKCLKSSIYQNTPLEAQALSVWEDDKKDDIKCSICQEEYEEGDEVGKLVQCAHGYHLECINHWLSLKNWCPICKLSAAAAAAAPPA